MEGNRICVRYQTVKFSNDTHASLQKIHGTYSDIVAVHLFLDAGIE
jgi:hypothetical protein